MVLTLAGLSPAAVTAEPKLLAPSELDAVTAGGIRVDASAFAQASGDYALAQARSQALVGTVGGREFGAGFAEGLGAMAGEGGCPLIGGDTVSTPGPLTLSITAFGSVPAGRMVLRSGAKPGDIVAVTGTIGDGALGLKAHGPDRPAWVGEISEADRAFLADRYLHPQPRTALAAALQAHASAAMDISDGLVGDLAKLLAASKAGAEIDLDAVPLSPAARNAVMADPALAELAWTGGDDYEILCTVPEGEFPSLFAAAKAAGLGLTCIGRVTAEAGTVRYTEAGRPRAFARGSFLGGHATHVVIAIAVDELVEWVDHYPCRALVDHDLDRGWRSTNTSSVREQCGPPSLAASSLAVDRDIDPIVDRNWLLTATPRRVMIDGVMVASRLGAMFQ